MLMESRIPTGRELPPSLKLQLVVVFVQVNHQYDEKHEVDDEPHHKTTFLTFIFNMVRHDFIFLMNCFV